MEEEQMYSTSKHRFVQRKHKKNDNWRRASTSAVYKATKLHHEKRRNTIATPTPRIHIETLDEEDEEGTESPIETDYDESFLNPCYALDAAVARNDSKQLEAILSSGAMALDKFNASGGTAMHEAAFQGKIECLSVFLRFGSDVNLKDKEGWTPLHAAVCGGHAQVVAFLISRGANLCATTDDGLRALEIATDAKNTKVLRVLSIAEAGAKACLGAVEWLANVRR